MVVLILIAPAIFVQIFIYKLATIQIVIHVLSVNVLRNTYRFIYFYSSSNIHPDMYLPATFYEDNLCMSE